MSAFVEFFKNIVSSDSKQKEKVDFIQNTQTNSIGVDLFRKYDIMSPMSHNSQLAVQIVNPRIYSHNELIEMLSGIGTYSRERLLRTIYYGIDNQM